MCLFYILWYVFMFVLYVEFWWICITCRGGVFAGYSGAVRFWRTVLYRLLFSETKLLAKVHTSQIDA